MGPTRALTRALGGNGVLLMAILVAALNLRTPLTALPPVVSEVSVELQLTAATAGLLTGIPVLCFALTTPAAAALLGRISLRSGVLLALLLVLAGTCLRSVDLGGLAVAGAFAGTVLIGLGITTANVAVPMITQRTFPTRVSTVTGIYTAVINTGTMVSTALTAPLAHLIGWRWALASWAVLGVLAVAWWWLAVPTEGGRRGHPLPQEGSRPARAAGSGEVRDAVGGRSVLREKYTWALCVMFGMQASSYYGLTAWLPLILADLAEVPVSASGAAASLFQGFAVLGSLGASVGIRYAGLRPSFIAIACGWLSLPLALLVAPGVWMVGVSLAGAAQGANFVLVFTLISRRFASVHRARKASATVQSVGYSLAAVAPTMVGGVHTLTGGWQVPVAIVAGALVIMTVLGVLLTGSRTPRA
ncbi:CynX/NimT family MFS transporter [Ruania alba]|uniref:MFS transporter, CP family, cyanate transporter n=1 Tax=Ruania alba TaxID=648782 RepID=A0A1H5N0D1_9MICO|nr:MFS transporter [Ruania alba]SEE94900.1 MFS transporter, CP family, cyanate transporter [Ruania alba]